MKKLIITVLFMLAISLTACTDAGNDTEGSSNTQSNSGNQSEETEKEDFVIEAPADNFQETLCDNELYTIKVEKIEVDDDYNVTLSITNKSSGDIKFLIHEPAINGVMYDEPAEFVSVSKGKTKEYEISIRGSWLEKYDMHRITEVFYTIEAANQLLDRYIQTELCASYPYGEAEMQYYKYELTDADVLVTDTEEYRVYVSLDVRSTSVEMQVYAQNNTDKTVRIGGYYPAANNRMLSLNDNIGTYVAPGKCALTQITIGQDDLEKVGITKTEELIKFSNIYKVTIHNESLYTFGGDTTEDVFEQMIDLFVSGKENVEITMPEIDGKQLWDDDYCTLYYVGYSYGEEAAVNVCLINKTNRTLNVYIAENMIEEMVEGFGTNTTVLSGAICYMSMTWQLEDLQEAGITFGLEDGTIYSFEMELHYADTEKFLYEKIFRNQTLKKD